MASLLSQGRFLSATVILGFLRAAAIPRERTSAQRCLPPGLRCVVCVPKGQRIVGNKSVACGTITSINYRFNFWEP